MKSEEIFNKIEKLIDDKINKPVNSKMEIEVENKSDKKEFKDILYLLMQLLFNVIKTPFKIVAKFLRDEIIIAAKKDAKIYMLIMGIMGVLFVFFSVIWLFISVAIGVYYYDKGYTMFVSIIYSIGFQLISFILVGSIALIASSKLKSLKILKNLMKLKNIH